jgi:hypothetical protein
MYLVCWRSSDRAQRALQESLRAQLRRAQASLGNTIQIHVVTKLEKRDA